MRFREKYLYYTLIVIVTLISLVFLPMVGLDQEGNINLNIPSSTMGWVVWGVSKMAVCVLNCLLFHFFVQQGKDNIRDNEVYKECLEQEGKLKETVYEPVHPKKLEEQAYLTKGGTVLLSTAVSLLALPSAVLQWSLMSFLSTMFSVVIAICFGFMQMRNTEDRWTWKYKEYIEYTKNKNENSNTNAVSVVSDDTDSNT